MLRTLLICLSCFLNFALFAQVPSVAISPLNPSICSGNNITLTASTNAAPGATFLWMPGGATTASISVSPSITTTYTCTVSANNQSNSSTTTITVNPVPTGTISVGANGNLTANSNTPACCYFWSNGAATQTINATISPGIYCVIITNTLGCNSAPICVNIPNPTILYANAGMNGTINCTLNPTGYQLGTSPIAGHSYSWSPTTGLNNPNIANPIALPSVTTTYTLTETDINGNQIIDQVIVTVNTTPPIINAGPDQTVCQGASLTLNALSNAPTISWSNGVLNNVPFVANNLGTTTYTATATGANGCVATDQVMVSVNPTPVATVTASGPLALCPGQSVTLCAYANQLVGYVWCTGETTQCITVNSPGNYCLVLQGLNGCMSSTINTIVTVANSPIANAGPDVSIGCSGSTSSAIIGSSGQIGSTYSWNPSTGLSNPNIANPIANPTTSTTYTLTVTNSNGCIATDQVVVTVNTTPPTVNIIANGGTLLCPGSSITLVAMANPGCTFTWKKNGIPQSNGNLANFVAFQPGTYTVTATNSNGCTSTSNSIVISLLQANIQALGPTTICQGSSVVLQATTGNGYTYQWVKNGNPSLSFGPNATYNAISSGTYSVNILTPTGCLVSSNTIQVQVLANPTVHIIATGSTTICSGSSLTLIANSSSTGLTYQWKKNGISITGATNSFYSVTQAGTYAVVVSNTSCPNNQVSSNSITVSVNPSPVPTINASTLLITPGATATLSTPLVVGYTYQWQKFNGAFPISIPGATANTYTTSIGATYRVRATNTFGCSGYSPQVTLVNTLLPEIENPKTNKIDSNGETQLYPNPNNGLFTVEIPSELVGQDMQILDINGRIIQIVKLNEQINSIDTEELARGTYWLQIGSQKPIQMIKN